MSNMWMVRAGESAGLIDDFKDMNLVAICWQLSDLSNKSDEDIKKLVTNNYKDTNNLSKGINASQLIKFVNVFEIGDWVVSYNSTSRKYLIGKITSDYYYSDKLAKKYNQENFCSNMRDVEWIGEVKRDDLSKKVVKSLNAVTTIFNLNNAKNEILSKINFKHIEWTDFYMELADKLLEFKDNRQELIRKIQNVYSNLNMDLPTLDRDDDKNAIIPNDIDPFTIFALFNKGITNENRINIAAEMKNEFSVSSKAPPSFNGIPRVNNLKATFYWLNKGRGEKDIDNLWNVFELAIKYSKNKDDEIRKNLIDAYDIVLTQKAVKWNITMGLYWIRPYTFINLDSTNRNLLSNDPIFSEELRNDIKSLKNPPYGEKYLQICDDVYSTLNKTEKYDDFPNFSLSACFSKPDEEEDIITDEGIDSDVETVSYWVYSPGSGAEFWDEFYEKGIMGIGFVKLGNLKKYENKTEIRAKLQEINNDTSKHTNDVHATWQFANEIKEGDIIFAKKGWDEIIGRGIVESDYEYNENITEYNNLRKVKWTHKGNWHFEYSKLPTKTLTDITIYTEFLNNIKNLFLDENENIIEEEKSEYPEYSIEKFLEEVYISEEEYYTLVSLLTNKKNIIIQGAPGVGKTFMAKRLAYSMMGVKDVERVLMVQFHQSYAYEDFVMGYKPSKEGFEIRTGAFYNFCKKAEEDSENDYFFIIDEINRGNLSKIFGELFMLIENDKRGEKNKIQLLYHDELFFIPKNLYIIGLMNTADRSLAMIDYALRRRFAFFDLKPGFNSKGFKEYQEELNESNFDNLIEVMIDLNNEIKNDESLGEGFRIGHSYLCNIKPDEIEDKLNYIIEYELIPLLKEYWFDEPNKIENWSNRLRSVIN